MFASSYPSPASARRQLGGLYQQVGVETQLAGASPHHLVAMLFDGYMEALAQARGAMRAGQIEIKGRAISRALRIIDDGLQGSLNMKEGGKIAADLDDLYTYVSLRLIQANARNDEAGLLECIALIEPISTAWSRIAPNAAAAAPMNMVPA